MGRSASLLAIALVLPVSASCATCGPDERVTVEVEFLQGLGEYIEGAGSSVHTVDVRFFKVDDADSFLANEASALRVADGGAIPGGQSIGRYEIRRGEKAQCDLGAGDPERWTHIGVCVALRAPADLGDAVKRVLPVPGDCGCRLSFDDRGIVAFTD